MTRLPETISSAALDDRPREECGVVGISGVDNAAELVFLGLYALQHRGQESAGIVSISPEGSRTHKGLGLVADVFDAHQLRQLQGSTRHRTRPLFDRRWEPAPERSTLRRALLRGRPGDRAQRQPDQCDRPEIRLVREGAIFQTTSDSEVIVHLIARSRHHGVDAQIDDALSQLEGAFSLVMAVGETLYAVRDPRGFRPLLLGRKGRGHVVASESCAFDIMGAHYVRDIEPGEVIKIRGRSVESLRPLAPAGRPAPCIFELVYFARPDSRLWG